MDFGESIHYNNSNTWQKTESARAQFCGNVVFFMFFWGGLRDCHYAVFLLRTLTKKTSENKGTVGPKKKFLRENPCLCCFIGLQRVFEKICIFHENFGFSQGPITEKDDFWHFPRLSVPTNGAGGIFPENHQKYTKKTSKTIIFYVFELFFIVFLMLFLVFFHVFSCCFPCFFDVF